MSGTINNSAIKRLYGLSAGRCNICKVLLLEESVHIGEMAHIIAKSSNGTRGDISNANDNSYENLILLCANDHTRVDQDPFNFTVERLHQIKNEHESYIVNVTDFNKLTEKRRSSDVIFLNSYFRFTPFERSRSLVDTLPNSFHIHLLSFGDMFDCILLDLPASYPLNDSYLQEKFNNFILAYHGIYDCLREQIPTFNDLRIEVFLGANDNGYCHFNCHGLPYDVANEKENIFIQRKFIFLQAFNDLLQYIRTYYQEVEISSNYF
ncbi:HNH endonuclease [Enterobacter roggenkampii]|uniref:HNH endonuclease signature motif containing protein n=1 Tax=Enterobacter roggenkampii TaxID=1812935 RepID=UPI002002B1D8|nr:HNH endonuclease signature motif containing protein [Enterobacter roggenkampii]MCK6924303.1 HNH endonuclease [Enterobacter roggenkampii]